MRQVTMYHRASGGGVKVWRITVDGPSITKEWGLRGAKMQRAVDPKRPKGKEGTKAFKSPEQVAQEDFLRQIDKKKDEGYVENIDDVLHTVQVQAADFSSLRDVDAGTYVIGNEVGEIRPPNGFNFDNPPKSFAPAKPIVTPDIALFQRLAAKGDLILQRKRDGGRHYIINSTERCRIFTRKMENVTAQFPDVVEAIEEAMRSNEVLHNAIIDSEFCVDVDGQDSRDLVGSVCRSEPMKAIRNQQGLNCFFYVFDLLYAMGAPIFSEQYRRRHEMADAVVKLINHPKVTMAENLDVSEWPIADGLEAIFDKICGLGWEGLVAWNAAQGSQVQLNGKPKRTNAFKVKPVFEDDFVGTHYELGDGKNHNVVGAIYISQYKDGQLVPCGRVGTGFTDTGELGRRDALGWQYPCVVEVKFASRTKDYQCIEPVILRRRFDKAAEECLLPT